MTGSLIGTIGTQWWTLLAQIDVPPALDAAPKVSLLRMVLDDGGWTMWIILGLSAVAVCMTLYFLMTLRFNLLMPAEFRRQANDVAQTGDAAALLELCNANRSAGASIIGAAAQLLMDNPRAEYLIVRDVIEGEGGRQANTLWQRIQYLMDVAVVAPMFGLLGTVFGMIQAFAGMKDNLAGLKPTALADGVSKALITTAGGLVLGIFAMMLYGYFRGRVGTLIALLEESCGSIIQRFIAATHDQRSPFDDVNAPRSGRGPGKTAITSTVSLTPRDNPAGPVKQPPRGTIINE